MAALALSLVFAPWLAGAQRPDSAARAADSTRAAQRRPTATGRPVPRDSLRPPLSPGRAFLYSFLLPGFGQARLQRHAAGAVYSTIEAVAIAMAIKSANELRIARAREHDAIIGRFQTDNNGAPITDSTGFVPADTIQNRYAGTRVKARRTHYEDWIATLVFNHLFSGADAFVSAQLWDLPAEVGFRASPLSGAVRLRIRW